MTARLHALLSLVAMHDESEAGPMSPAHMAHRERLIIAIVAHKEPYSAQEHAMLGLACSQSERLEQGMNAWAQRAGQRLELLQARRSRGAGAHRMSLGGHHSIA